LPTREPYQTVSHKNGCQACEERVSEFPITPRPVTVNSEGDAVVSLVLRPRQQKIARGKEGCSMADIMQPAAALIPAGVAKKISALQKENGRIDPALRGNVVGTMDLN